MPEVKRTRLYLCTLYEITKYGDSRPVMIEGQECCREYVALTAGKARMEYWRDLRDAWPDVRIQDIRVKSLSKRVATPLTQGWRERLEKANAIIRVIGSHGRRFLSENSDRRESELTPNPFFAYFFVDSQNELWYVDRYTRRPILVRLQDWSGFSDGGTLRSIIVHLAHYINACSVLEMRHFGPFPYWLCGGDPWGYGLDEMEKVREGIKAIHPWASRDGAAA